MREKYAIYDLEEHKYVKTYSKEEVTFTNLVSEARLFGIPHTAITAMRDYIFNSELTDCEYLQIVEVWVKE